MLVCAIVAGCGSSAKAYDWAQVKKRLEGSLSEGTGVERASRVLDSLGFNHNTLDPRDGSMIGRRREPDVNKLLFGTLRVVLTFDKSRRLAHREIREILTGP